MKVFYWDDINTWDRDFFNKGTGISVGSFDGIHKGHKVLLNNLINNCKENNLISGVITFTKPLPSIKHSGDYAGDILTIEQKLNVLSSMGIDFTVIVEFNQDFARMSGQEFFSKLIDVFNLKFLAEGIDFKCGYKGSTGHLEIMEFCKSNNIKYHFEGPVYFTNSEGTQERISSSIIRKCIAMGDIKTAEMLLGRKFVLDVSKCNIYIENNNSSSTLFIEKNSVAQVCPSIGEYEGTLPDNTECNIKITEDKIVINNGNLSVIDKDSLLNISFI